MSGDDIVWWLDGIWYDVTHLATADVPSLLFRLLVLFAVIVIGQKVIRIVLRICADILRPVVQLIRDILRGIWWVMSSPVRVPLGWVRKMRRAKEDRENARRWEMQRQQNEAAEQDRIAADKNRIAADIRAQNQEYQRMKAMMNKLE